MVEDLESAIAFYGTPAFQSGLFSIGRRLIPVTISPDPKHPEVQDLAAFLRVLNALENIRSSISVAQRGRIMDAEPDARELAGLAQAETIDAIEVLSKGALAETTEKSIHLAKLRLSEGRTFLQLAQDLPTRAAVNNAIEHASRSLRSAREALANPGTLPPSYRN